MNADGIRAMLNRFPFQPFEIIMSSGEHHRVTNRDRLIIQQTQVTLGDLYSDHVTFLALRHITELRPIVPQESR